jgi:GntR family transcriptional repressor for pyruvate dehydrogenase complex
MRLGPFAPVEHVPRAEAVVHRLTEAIELGVLEDGEQLPSETELASRMHVSTVTLREALVALREQGLVQTLRGRNGGSFVRQPADLLAGALSQRLTGLSTDVIRDYGDHYSAVAGVTASLAAARMTRDELTRLAGWVDVLAEATELPTRGRADSRLGVELAAAAQSVRLTATVIELQAEFGGLLWLPLNQDETHERVVAHRRKMIDALRTRRASAARKLGEQYVVMRVSELIDLRHVLLRRSKKG